MELSTFIIASILFLSNDYLIYSECRRRKEEKTQLAQLKQEKIANGVASATVSGLKVGTYSVSAKYAGSTNFNAQTVTSSFAVTKTISFIQSLSQKLFNE